MENTMDGGIGTQQRTMGRYVGPKAGDRMFHVKRAALNEVDTAEPQMREPGHQEMFLCKYGEDLCRSCSSCPQ